MSFEESGAFDLARTFVHLGQGSTATPLPDFEWSAEQVEAYRRRFAADGKEGRLVCVIAQDDVGRLGAAPGRRGGRLPHLRQGRCRAGHRRHRPRGRAATGSGHGEPGERVAHGPGPRAGAGAVHHTRRRHGAPAARLSRSPQRADARSCGPCGGYPPASRMAWPHGTSTPISSSTSSPRPTSAGSHWASVATSTDSRSVRPASVRPRLPPRSPDPTTGARPHRAARRTRLGCGHRCASGDPNRAP